MKALTSILALMIAMGFASTANAGKGAKPAKDNKTRPEQGLVVKTDKDTITFKVGNGKKAKETTIACNDKTIVTIDGQKGKLEDIKADSKVSIVQQAGTATEIKVITSKAHATKGAKKAKAPKNGGVTPPAAPGIDTTKLKSSTTKPSN